MLKKYQAIAQRETIDLPRDRLYIANLKEGFEFVEIRPDEPIGMSTNRGEDDVLVISVSVPDGNGWADQCVVGIPAGEFIRRMHAMAKEIKEVGRIE